MSLPTTCPRCNAELERGSITGQGVYINWIPQGDSVGWITLGKEHLATGSLSRPPTLSGARCTSCGLGIFGD